MLLKGGVSIFQQKTENLPCGEFGYFLGLLNCPTLSFFLVFAGGCDAADGCLQEDVGNMSIQETDQDEISRDMLDIRKSGSLQPR